MTRPFVTRIPGPRPPVGGSVRNPADGIIRFSEAVSSALHETTSMVMLDLVGLVDPHDQTDLTKAETDNQTDVYSAMGIVGRPLPPRLSKRAGAGATEHMDALAIAVADGLVPFAFRDTRLVMPGNGPREGTFAFLGYGGGFHSMTPVTDPRPNEPGKNPKNPDPSLGGTIHVLYCPYDYDADGVPQKAHVITMDPTSGNESISIVHADGMAMTMFDGALVLKNRSGDATFRLDDDGITMTAKNVTINAGCVIGDAASAVPLLPGVASPGSTKLYVSP